MWRRKLGFTTGVENALKGFLGFVRGVAEGFVPGGFLAPGSNDLYFESGRGLGLMGAGIAQAYVGNTMIGAAPAVGAAAGAAVGGALAASGFGAIAAPAAAVVTTAAVTAAVAGTGATLVGYGATNTALGALAIKNANAGSAGASSGGSGSSAGPAAAPDASPPSTPSLGKQIADGHAFGKHVLERGEFRGLAG
jgi:hypothetical protein